MKRKRNSFRFKRRFITFVEIMIIITILIITLGLIGVNIRDLIRQQRFKSEVSLVIDQLRLAQDLMLMLNTDAIFKMAKVENGTVVSIHVESALSKGWNREIKRPHPPLKSISSIEFDDVGSGIKNSELPISLNFLSGGSVMSQGILRLANKDWEMETFVCLPGYPRVISNVNDPKEDLFCSQKGEADFIEKLTFYTRREIEEKTQKTP